MFVDNRLKQLPHELRWITYSRNDSCKLPTKSMNRRRDTWYTYSNDSYLLIQGVPPLVVETNVSRLSKLLTFLLNELVADLAISH